MSETQQTQVSERVEYEEHACGECSFTGASRCVLNDMGRIVHCNRMKVTSSVRNHALFNIDRDRRKNLAKRARELSNFYDQQWRDKLGDFDRTVSTKSETISGWSKRMGVAPPPVDTRHVADDKEPCPRCLEQNPFLEVTHCRGHNYTPIRDILGPSKLALRSILLRDPYGNAYARYVQDLAEELGGHYDAFELASQGLLLDGETAEEYLNAELPPTEYEDDDEQMESESIITPHYKSE